MFFAALVSSVARIIEIQQAKAEKTSNQMMKFSFSQIIASDLMANG